ncbi:hypothetical protein [Pedobacter sp. FW305-3-2-15-E-R2A2]|uniref:hypothetical protein n=1 Tax=Pedobacter sp. FW305-3-2-15-E-R2A2 TaxID=3140251 RepID=UPI00313FF07A
MENDKINISGVETDLVETTEKPVKLGVLNGKNVAISVSVSEDLEKNGFSEQHLNDISIEIARYIIANDGVAMYGGDLRVGGFTYYFSELSNQYKKPNDKSFKFINYFVFPNTKALTRDVRIDFQSKQILVKEIELPKTLVIDRNREYSPLGNNEDRFTLCECFRNLRDQMTKDCKARVLVGGKISNYLGYIPGIIEEALTTLIENKPVFLVGGFGGATSKLIGLIKGESVDELTDDFQYNTIFLKGYKEYIVGKYKYSNYEDIKQEFANYNVERLSELNKLSVEENEILFESKNIHEIVYLIMKGLRAI